MKEHVSTMTNNKKSDRIKYDNLGIIAIAALSFVPSNSDGDVVRIGVVALLFLGVLLIKKQIILSNEMVSVIVIIAACTVLTLLIGFFYDSIPATWKHEMFRNLFICIVIVVVSNLRCTYKFLYIVFLGILFVNTAIQILEFFKVPVVFQIIEQYYGGEGNVHMMLAFNSSLKYFRAGSIFLNPNIYMVIPLISITILLQNTKIKNTKWNYFFLLVSFVSIFLTGSRTAFLLGGAIVGYFMIIDNRKKVGIAFLGIVVVIFIALLLSKSNGTIRLFDVKSGMSNSVGYKLRQMQEYIKNADAVPLLLGSLGVVDLSGIDFEWGYIVAYYGIGGIIWYCLLIKNIRGKNTISKFFTLSLKGIMILLSVTASVLLCMQICTLFLLIAFVQIDTDDLFVSEIERKSA